MFGHKTASALLFQLLLKTSNNFQLSIASQILKAASSEFKADEQILFQRILKNSLMPQIIIILMV